MFRFQQFYIFVSEFLSAISQKFKLESKEIYFLQGRKHCFTYVAYVALLFLYSTQKKVIVFVNAYYNIFLSDYYFFISALHTRVIV